MYRLHEDNCEQGFGLARWFSGNIRRKLTLFVVIILVMVVGLFWFFSVFMLKPAYENSINLEMEQALYTVTNILDKVYEEGYDLIVFEQQDNGVFQVGLSQEVRARLKTAIDTGQLNLTGRCLDIADTAGQNLFLADYIEPACLLHPNQDAGLTARGVVTYQERNSEVALRARQLVVQNGLLETTERGQRVMGALAADSQLVVVVSATLERIPQAVNVLQRLLLPLSLLLSLFAITATWVFSRWFTRPINRLSAAAREMAHGNYNVQVEDCGDDEIGDLARDFNTMAHEVGRSAALQRDLLANVSHDLRTPLTLIKGYAETVRDLSGDDPVRRTEQLNVIVDESDRLNALVGSVMELSRMSSGTEKPEPVRFDLAQLCDEVADRYAAVADRQGYQFHFSGSGGPCLVVSDPNLLERALHNLLGNAVNHVGEDGFVGLAVHKTKYGYVRVEISDHGPGIAAEDLPHIFDRYYRSRADAGKPGTGLGLSITKAIFVALNIDYGVNSTPGVGSTFWFETPPAP